MAKAKEVNRSQAIRDAFEELPKAKAKQIVAHLKEKGIHVSDQLVYQVKKMSKKGKRGRRGRKPMASGMMTARQSGKIHLGVAASIALVRTTAAKVGGMASLKEIVEALA